MSDAATTDIASPYRHFSRQEWASLRADTPLLGAARLAEELAGEATR